MDLQDIQPKITSDFDEIVEQVRFLLQGFLFEVNNEQTRAKVKDTIANYIRTLEAHGCLKSGHNVTCEKVMIKKDVVHPSAISVKVDGDRPFQLEMGPEDDGERYISPPTNWL